MIKIRIPKQLKSIAIRLIIYILTVLFGVALNHVPRTWIVTFAVLTIVIALSFVFTAVKHKWIYMSLIVVFSILFTKYFLEPQYNVFRERYNKIVNEFETLPEKKINKLRIIYKRVGNYYGEYEFIILSPELINNFQKTISATYSISNYEFTGHYDQLYLVTAFNEDTTKYSFLFRKEYTDNRKPMMIKNKDGIYVDNSKYLDKGQLEVLYNPYKEFNSVYDMGRYIALYRCQELILFLNKHVKSKVEEEPYKLHWVIK